MTQYMITFETDDDNGDYFYSYDEEEAEKEYRDIISNPHTTEASMTEYYIYGGMCQGEKETKKYIREDKEK